MSKIKLLAAPHVKESEVINYFETMIIDDDDELNMENKYAVQELRNLQRPQGIKFEGLYQ